MGVSSARHGVVCIPGGPTRFQVWAPHAGAVEVVFEHGTSGGPAPSPLPMSQADGGYWVAEIDRSLAGLDYKFRLRPQEEKAGLPHDGPAADPGEAWPDPASRHQPHGVHGASRITDLAFPWPDSEAHWTGIPLDDYIIYELHVGAFSPEGTFEGVAERLGYLRELGITAIEIMPVAQFPGERNWGYDGVYPFAVQDSYGGPEGLQRLVAACHAAGLAVVLDVVYNHWGPEGNYSGKFGPYFSSRYHTPWGEAVNFDDAGSDAVRDFVVENAAYWVSEFHIDALRLDAVHSIFDESAYPILEEIADAVHRVGSETGRQIHVIAESSLNDPRLCLPKSAGGMGLDGQWNDDFHHALRTVLTGDRSGYYASFGRLEQLATALRDGFVFQGEHSVAYGRRHGRPSKDLQARQLVVFSQNHDQVGNRMLGERSSQYLSAEELKLAAATVLLSGYVPLLFMGEEYGEVAPFLYFVEHSDHGLIEGVRRGRKAEFAAFAWRGAPPDPQAPETFEACKLDLRRRQEGPHRKLFQYYRELIRLRKEVPALGASHGIVRSVQVHSGPGATASLPDQATMIEEHRHVAIGGHGESAARLLLNFSTRPEALPEGFGEVDLLQDSSNPWLLVLDSAASRWSPEQEKESGQHELGHHELGHELEMIAPRSVRVWVRQTGR